MNTPGAIQGEVDSAGRPPTGWWTWPAIVVATAAPYAWRFQSGLDLGTSAYAGICAALFLWTVILYSGERRLLRKGRNNRVASLRRSALVQCIVTLGLSMTPSGLGLTVLQIPALLLVDATTWGPLWWLDAGVSDVSHLEQAFGFGSLALLAGMTHFVLILVIDVLFGTEKPAVRWHPRIPKTLAGGAGFGEE